jgi:hypothetical protein
MVTFEVILRQAEDPSSQGERTAFNLSPGEEIVFGRAPDVEITIPDPKVSGRHGKLLCDPSGELLAFDSGSLNGTFVPATSRTTKPSMLHMQLALSPNGKWAAVTTSYMQEKPDRDKALLLVDVSGKERIVKAVPFPKQAAKNH